MWAKSFGEYDGRFIGSTSSRRRKGHKGDFKEAASVYIYIISSLVVLQTIEFSGHMESNATQLGKSPLHTAIKVPDAVENLESDALSSLSTPFWYNGEPPLLRVRLNTLPHQRP